MAGIENRRSELLSLGKDAIKADPKLLDEWYDLAHRKTVLEMEARPFDEKDTSTWRDDEAGDRYATARERHQDALDRLDDPETPAGERGLLQGRVEATRKMMEAAQKKARFLPPEGPFSGDRFNLPVREPTRRKMAKVADLTETVAERIARLQLSDIGEDRMALLVTAHGGGVTDRDFGRIAKAIRVEVHGSTRVLRSHRWVVTKASVGRGTWTLGN